MTHAPAVPSRFSRRLLGALLLASAFHVSTLPAQEPAEPPAKEVSEKVSEEFAKLRPLIEAKNFAEALKLIDNVLSERKTETYDVVGARTPRAALTLVIHRRSGERVEVPVTCRLDTAEEVSIYEAGGVLQRFAKDFLESTTKAA